MMYKAKDGHLYRVRNAERRDILQMVRVHNASACKTYEPFREQYPHLYAAFSKANLKASWDGYFDKCEQNQDFMGIVVEKLTADSQGNTQSRIVGVCKAGTLSPQYREHLEEVRGRKFTDQEVAAYANLQTIYIDPAYQGLGLGRAVMGYFANHYSAKGCRHALTETLSGYAESPKFFNRVGGAECLGDYSEDPQKAVNNSNQAAGQDIPLKLWLMPDLSVMKMTCYFEQKYREQQAKQAVALRLAANGGRYGF